MKTHTQTPGSPLRTLRRLGWLCLIPVLAHTLRAQPVGPEMEIERAAAIVSWPVSDTNYIVVTSANPTGPWVPCLDPIAYGPDGCQVAVRTTDHSQYFQLAKGVWFMEDFEDGDLEGLNVLFVDPRFEDYASLDPTNGQLRIHGTWGGREDDRGVYCFWTNAVVADYTISVDVLNWAAGLTASPRVALVGRATPGVITANTPHYLGGLTIETLENWHNSSIWIWKWYGTYGASAGEVAFPGINPANDYRFVFRVVGNHATVELYDLADLSTPIRRFEATDASPLPPGWVGFFVNDRGSSGTLDITIDNIVVVGTTP